MHWYIRFQGSVTDFGSRISFRSSVSIISSSGLGLALVKYLSMKSPISFLFSWKKFPEIDEFRSETSRFVWSCVDLDRQHVFIWHEQAGEKHTGEGPCLPFGQSANTLQPSCGTITKRIFILGLWLVHSLCFVYTKLCSNAPFYWMISNNHVNSSHLEIVTLVLVCDTWGSARVTESKPSVKMGHFGVISLCQINQHVDHLQILKHLWVEYSKKEHV